MNKDNFKKMYDEHLIDQNDIYNNVTQKIESARPVNKLRVTFKPVIALCLALVLLAGGFSGFAIWTDAKEYREAVAFFEEYNLPLEGLSRSDIKAVYKDIILKTFSYEKTLEILNTFSLELYSIELGTKSKEELEALWNYRNSLTLNSLKKTGIHYKTEQSDEVLGFAYKQIIKKYDGEKLLWSRTIEHYVLPANFIETPSGTVLFGTAIELYQDFGIVIMFDENGNVLWEKSDDEMGSRLTAGVLDNNEIAVFGIIPQYEINNNKCIFIYRKYDLKGNLVQKNERQMNIYTTVSAAALINDYYLLKFGSRDDIQLISVSKQGEFINKFSYFQDGKEYYIVDIYSYNNKIYLSTILPNIDKAVFDKDLGDLMTEYFDAWKDGEVNMPESYNKRLRDLFIRQYTAVLLICDEKGNIETAYSVTNARGGSFSVSTYNLLQWQVIRIDDVKNAHPAISSRSFDITATDFRFEFNENGQMVKKTEIGFIPLFY